jgi:hypothetical protein
VYRAVARFEREFAGFLLPARKSVAPDAEIGSIRVDERAATGFSATGTPATQNVVQNFGGASVTDDTTLAPGQISIRASISASVALESGR